jgi:hypothetical protein
MSPHRSTHAGTGVSSCPGYWVIVVCGGVVSSARALAGAIKQATSMQATKIR